MLHDDEFKDFAVRELSPFWTLFVLVAVSCIVGTTLFFLAMFGWRWLL